MKKFIGKIFYWENYESGSCCIKINKINKDKTGKFTFDGILVTYETVNGNCDGDGFIMTEVEDYPFDKLPYCYQEWGDDEETYEALDCAEEWTLNNLYSSLYNIYNMTKCLFEQYFNCRIN